MLRSTLVLVTVLCTAQFQFARAQQPVIPGQGTPDPVANDPRLLVDMPDAARALMRQDMLQHMAALNEIIGHLANNNLAAAADMAETGMGSATMGKHRGTGMGPGRFMPPEMHSIGMGMHRAADEFANQARTGDLAATLNALTTLTGSCAACHNAFRTR